MKFMPLVKKLPTLFHRFPAPRTNCSLEGMIQIDLGTWQVAADGTQKKCYLNVYAKRLPDLVREMQSPSFVKRFGYGCIEVFLTDDIS